MHDLPNLDQVLPETENWVRSTQLSRRGMMVAGVAATGYALAAQPISAAAITTDVKNLTAGMVQFKTGDILMGAYRAKPKGRKKAPVIIVVQEIFGLHEWIKDICRRFAKAGYYAIAPDLYQRQGDATKVAEIRKLVSDIVSKVPDAQVMADLDACAAFSGSDGGNSAKLGITGFCWGGRVTWLYSAHNPKLKAGVAWYGRVVTRNAGGPPPLQPTDPITLAGKLNAPVLGLYGGQDKGIPVKDVEDMNAALKAAGSPSSITLYPDADHGFLADYRPSYNASAAGQAWDAALAHFAKHLK
jgi:carboxymethylenebutenolidase